MTEEQIKHLKYRFLSWRLPKDFSPDGGITYKAELNEHTARPTQYMPTGTNLFSADQADAMVRYMLEDLPSRAADPGSQWLHVKTGGIYTLLGGCCIEATNAAAVAYRNNATGLVWVRSTTEFYDGRFKRINVSELVQELQDELTQVKEELAQVKSLLVI